MYLTTSGSRTAFTKYQTSSVYFKLNIKSLTLRKKWFVLIKVTFHSVEDCLLGTTYLTRGTGKKKVFKFCVAEGYTCAFKVYAGKEK